MRVLVVLVASLLLCGLSLHVTGQRTAFSVNTSNGQFVCPVTNRTVLFHGVNMVEKKFPFVPPIYDGDLDMLQNLGFNLVRLGVMWPAVEPARGQYNYTYLNTLLDLVNQLGDHGVFTLVDFHQDLLHPSMCGEGIPDFAVRAYRTNCTGNFIEEVAKLLGACKGIKDYNMTTDPVTGYPKTEDCLQHEFSLFYPTPDVSSAFQSLYEDEDLLQMFTEYWQTVAQFFANSTYVIGYDLFNEPWPGMVWEDISLIVPKVGDLKHLQPLYQRLHRAIRQYDNQHILFYEGTQFPDTFPLFGGIVSANGFTESPGGSDYDDRQALSYHVYCCASGADSCDGDGNPLHDDRCDVYNTKKLRQRVQDAQRVNRGGGLMSEFGGCANVPACYREINRTVSVADDLLQSWIYWSFRNYDDITTVSQDESLFYPNGTLQYEKVRVLSRTYAQAIQGTPISQKFDSETAEFELVFTADPAVTSSTEIFFNTAFYYPNGFKYSGPSYTQSENRLILAPLKTVQVVTVSISPA